MTYYLIAAMLLAFASGFDGYTTVRFVRLGYEERTTRWLLGARPGPLVVYGRGGAFVALELILVYTLYRDVGSTVGGIFATALVGQAIVHVYEGVRNLRLR